MIYKGPMDPPILCGPEKGVISATTDGHSMTPEKPFRYPVEQEGAEVETDAMNSQSASPVDTRGTKLSGGSSRRKDEGGGVTGGDSCLQPVWLSS